MKNKITLVFMCFLLFGSLLAQQRECSTMQNLEYRKQLDPGLENRMQEIEQYTQTKVSQMTQNRIDGDIITIPVVVHVIYSNSNENISDAQILSQIQVLNDDFRRMNSDADNTWSQAADTQIQFCMATVDPNGNTTNGITRKSSTRTSWGTNDAMKSSSQGGVDPWNTSEYLNMWVCNIGGGILGYAQFPGGSAATDGVVMSPQYFGSSAGGSGFYLSAPFDLGRTTTHEVGHFLNLRHIWGDGNCSADDFVSDTPTSDAANYGCATGHVSCGTTDMVQNYMDYSDDSCMNLFTQGQKDRMRAILEPGGVRRSLALSDKCSGGGTTPTCSDGIQNGDETGVDCGGSCAPCQTGCNDNLVNVSITFDNYPEETSWAVTNDSGQTVASGGTYGSEPDGSTISEDLCLPDGCYTFTINDAYGDGICCSYGNGSYSVTDASGSLASGGSFGSSEATQFCVGGGTAPTCDDGIQNGDETGVDCGGSCAPCVVPSTCTSTVTSFPYTESFESGDGWTQASGDDGDWVNDSNGTPSSNTGPSSGADGSFYMFLEASTNGSTGQIGANATAILESPCFDLSGESQATFSFQNHMYGTSVGSITLQASLDEGDTWSTLWSLSGNQGNQWNSESVDLSSYVGQVVSLRFVGTTGSSWSSDIAIDDLQLSTDGSGGGTECDTLNFNDYTLNSFSTQDSNGANSIGSGGASLTLTNNTWKYIDFPYTVTANTVIELEFSSSSEGEIHGIGFENDNSLTSSFYFKFYGTQNYGVTNYDNYTSGTTTYVIPVGDSYTGTMDRLVFINDNDAGSGNTSTFSNVKVYETSCSGTRKVEFGTRTDILGDEDELALASLTIYPNPVKNILHVSLNGNRDIETSYSIVNMLGQTVLRGNAVKEINVESLTQGVYFIEVNAGDEVISKKFIKQ